MQIEYQRKFDVRYKTDVLIAGGGPAGVAAAVMCARTQKKIGGNVLVLEQSGTFGGSSTLAGVPELMNFDDGMNFLAKGFGHEVYSNLYGECSMDRSWTTVRPEKLKLLYDRLVEESGAAYHFYSRIVDVIIQDQKITHVIVSTPEGLYAIETGIVVDCTGAGSVCAMAGCSFEYGDKTGLPMSATLCSLWGGVDFSQKKEERRWISLAIREGVFSQYDTVLPGIKPTYPEVGVGGGNIGHCFGIRDIETLSITKAMVEARRQLEEYQTYYRRYVPGCENAVLMDSANFLGIRESRRICCEEMLTESDFAANSSKQNEIGRYSYPIDIHPMTPDERGMQDFGKQIARRHNSGESYSIPYGCLVPKNIRNMLVAGRCVGTDHAMQASIRVIPGCYITGQAAGIAAALCSHSHTNTADADIHLLQRYIAEFCNTES